jgi:hypothetical protein
MKIIESPAKENYSNAFRIFLAGSIEMGRARMWQDECIKLMQQAFEAEYTNLEIVVLNPRRKDWDSSWVQQKENTLFHEQVSWELDGLEKADCIIYYFQNGTISPITLLELGLHARNNKALVICETGFHRKGNVDIVCERYGIAQFGTLEATVGALAERIKNKKMNR